MGPDAPAYGFMFVVMKPNGKIRLTCNTVAVNGVVRDHDLLSGGIMGDMFENVQRMAGADVKFEIDLSEAFLGVRLTEEASRLVTFCLGPHHKIRFHTCLFGPSSMPACFTKVLKEHVVLPSVTGLPSAHLAPGAARERDLSATVTAEAWLDDINGGGKGTARNDKYRKNIS